MLRRSLLNNGISRLEMMIIISVVLFTLLLIFNSVNYLRHRSRKNEADGLLEVFRYHEMMYYKKHGRYTSCITKLFEGTVPNLRNVLFVVGFSSVDESSIEHDSCPEGSYIAPTVSGSNKPSTSLYPNTLLPSSVVSKDGQSYQLEASSLSGRERYLMDESGKVIKHDVQKILPEQDDQGKHHDN